MPVKRVLVVVLLAVAMLLPMGAPAQAAPSGCQMGTTNGNEAFGVCWRGSGEYRVVALCDVPAWKIWKGDYFRYGNWVAGPPLYSWLECDSGDTPTNLAINYY